ncbi:ferritin-like domain-containing protein [Alistipes sp.]|uniref:YciE/YciF ferroxidase family protein n=1 Tax=Alistipes sp. TaxID=1872444 RepID=UPI003AF02961
MNTKNQTASESAAFREFFIDQIKDIYWAEKHLISGMKKMKRAATSPKLAEAFTNHIEESEGQIDRLKRVFELLGKRAQAKRCEAMEGIVAEAEEVIADTEKDTYTRDAALIMAAQKAEHYEIASYGTLKYYAELMGEDEISRELDATLQEEKNTDSLLTCLTEEGVREMAMAD